MKQYSDEFVLSQYRHYKKQLGIPGNGQNMNLGLYQQFEAEAKRRCLLQPVA